MRLKLTHNENVHTIQNLIFGTECVSCSCSFDGQRLCVNVSQVNICNCWMGHRQILQQDVLRLALNSQCAQCAQCASNLQRRTVSYCNLCALFSFSPLCTFKCHNVLETIAIYVLCSGLGMLLPEAD